MLFDGTIQMAQVKSSFLTCAGIEYSTQSHGEPLTDKGCSGFLFVTDLCVLPLNSLFQDGFRLILRDNMKIHTKPLYFPISRRNKRKPSYFLNIQL